MEPSRYALMRATELERMLAHSISGTPCRLGRALAAAGATITLAACTLLSDFDVRECAADADCQAWSGTAMMCVESRCVEGCINSGQCAALDPRYPLCPRVGAQCSPLVSDGNECFVSTGYDAASMSPWVTEDALVLGAFAPTLRSSTWLSIELAGREINAVGGLPVNGVPRPLLVVSCADALPSVTGALTHLTLIGARAVLASMEDRTLQAALAFPGTRGSLLFLSPHSSTLTPSDEGAELLWSLGGRAEGTEAVVPGLMQRAVDALAARGRAPTSIKVASVYSVAVEDQRLEAAVRDRLEIAGQNALSLGQEDRLRPFPLPEEPDLRAEVIATLLGYEPDIVLAFIGGSFPGPGFEPRTGLLRAIEDDAEQNGTAPPLYILGPRTAYEPEVVDLAARRPSFRARAAVVTSDPAVDESRRAALNGRFKAAFPEAKSVDPTATADWEVYDALYYLAYAAAAAPRIAGGYSAADMRAGLLQVTDDAAEAVGVGPGTFGLDRVTALLAEGVSFNTLGTSGPAGFGPSQSRPSRARALCWSADGALAEIPAEWLASGAAPPNGAPCATEILDAGG
jgi:hypothetical protein